MNRKEDLVIKTDLSRLLHYLKTRRGSYVAGALFLVGTNAFAMAIPWLMKLAVESLQGKSSGRSASWYAGMIIVVAVVHGIVRIFSRIALLNAGRAIEYAIRDDLYESLLRQDQLFFGRERTGDIMSRFTNDLTNVRMLCGFGVLNVINTILVYVSAIILMFRISPLLTIISVLPYPLVMLAVQKVSRRMFARSMEVQEELAALTSRVEENVSAATLIRGYCREDAAISGFAEAGKSYFQRNMELAKLRGLILPVMGGGSGAATLVLLFFGGRMVAQGTLTLGDFVAFSGYLAMLVWPTVMMGWILNLMQRGAASMARLAAILDAVPAVREPAEPVRPERPEGSISIRNLTYSHAETETLRGISLEIPAGARVGVVGEVGSGKSTLLSLIPRLLPPADGTVFVDGIDVNRMALGDLRDLIGFVPQSGFMFSRSVGENIAYGRDGASGDEVREAARRALLDETVERFPAGYETMVGERGVTLSGGQRQRGAIARALLKNPRILILDDCLSAVDAETEAGILRELRRYFSGRTVIFATHRLAPLRDFDFIVVLREGSIIEQGTHAELLALGGCYAALHREQELRREITEM